MTGLLDLTDFAIFSRQQNTGKKDTWVEADLARRHWSKLSIQNKLGFGG